MEIIKSKFCNEDKRLPITLILIHDNLKVYFDNYRIKDSNIFLYKGKYKVAEIKHSFKDFKLEFENARKRGN